MTSKGCILHLSAIMVAAILGSTSAYACAGEGSVRFSVNNVESANGLVRIGVYATEAEWRRLVPATWEYSARARKGTVSLCVKPPKRGKFAVLAFHDADNDNIIDNDDNPFLFFTVPLPTEGIGIGNDARLRPYPPFKSSVVEFEGPAQRSNITLKYCKIQGLGYTCDTQR